MILGKWEVLEPSVVKEMGLSTMEFTPEGAWRLTYTEANTSTTMNGKYSFLSEKVVELRLDSPPSFRPAGTVGGKVIVDATPDTLVLAPPEGQGDLTFKLKRKK